MANALRYSATLSLPAVRAQHLNLLQAWKHLDEAAKRKEAEKLRHVGADLGLWLRDPAERDMAQGIVDYWTSALASLPDQPFPDLLRLEEPSDEAGPAVAERMQSVYDDLPQDQRGQAKTLFQRLLLGPVRPEETASDIDLDAVRRRFQDAGVIVEGPGDEGLVIAHRALLIASWPKLDKWSADRQLDEAMVLNLEKSAAVWKASGQADDLLRGHALNQAQTYRDHSPEIAAYLDASVRRQTVQRMAVAGVAVGAALVIGGLSLATFDLGEKNTSLEDQLQDKDIVSERNIAELAPSTDKPVEKVEISKASEPPGVEGYIWIGGRSQQLLHLYPIGKRVTPVDVVKGGKYRARANIALRQSYPDADYNSAPRTGIVGDGAMVIALEPPYPIERPSGPQYWLHVRQAITVNIQYRGSPERAAALQKRLRDLGYDTPPVENRDASGTPAAEIRFYQAEERPFAERLKTELSQALAEAGQTTGTTCKLLTTLQPDRPYRLEVWVDFTARPIPDKPCPS